ncbi:hypothetical protein [Deinococcus planocerae]|uniref:hypothetical protein n=1 Tax=Deinococcus planocerae TaxID=1737569 RepID=UPI0011AEDD6D|nr:hypothetical protein [Deinococcus planocerae]
MFEVEIIRFTSGRRLENLSFESEAEVLEAIQPVGDPPTFYAFNRVKGRLSLSFFMVWFSGDRALVRLDKHREHYATDSALGTSDADEVIFDDGTEVFTRRWDETVTREQAQAAFSHWLTTGGRLESLAWS